MWLNGQPIIENYVLKTIPETGPIGIQYLGYPVQFANLYIKEL
jgi:hypothetical protein